MKIVLQTNDVKVSTHELKANESGKLHFHRFIKEHFFCLSGILEVKIFSPDETVILLPGESVLINPERRHMVANNDSSNSSYLIVQGIGEYDFIESTDSVL